MSQAYQVLTETYSLAIEKCVPRIKVNQEKKSNQKCMNNEIKRATKLKYKLYCKWRAARHNQGLKNSYSNACKHVKKLVRAAVISYESSIVTKSNIAF